MNSVCIVAIAKDELPFVDEWVAYHQLIGVDHIYLYDDEDGLPLKKHFSDCKFVTVIPWSIQRKQSGNSKNQIDAYNHAYKHYIMKYDWVCFLDIDEYLVFRNIDNVKVFLENYPDADAVSLNWHVFGHNGFYDDPDGFITTSLIRRMFTPNVNVKTISRTKNILEVTSAHYCELRGGKRVDVNHRKFTDALYDDKSKLAHVNHYQCRSFKRWMRRVERGDVNFNHQNLPAEQQWRLSNELCLKKFVTSIAFNKNEYIDEYMLKFEHLISEIITSLSPRSN